MNPVLYRLLGLSRVHELFGSLFPSGRADWRKFLEQAGIHVDTRGLGGLLPFASEPLIIAGNHPHGLFELFLTAYVLGDVAGRRDPRFIANEIIGQQFPFLAPHLIPVRNMGPRNAESSRFNQDALEQAARYLRQTPAATVAVFPAGTVSSFRLASPEGPLRVTDGPWRWSALKLMHATGARVVPMHISGGNSARFRLLGAAGTLPKRLLSFREFLRTRDKTIVVTFGPPLGPGDFKGDPRDLSGQILQLRKNVYALGGEQD